MNFMLKSLLFAFATIFATDPTPSHELVDNWCDDSVMSNHLEGSCTNLDDGFTFTNPNGLVFEAFDWEKDFVNVGLGISDPDPGQEDQYLRNMCIYLLYGQYDATFSSYGIFDTAAFIVGGPSTHTLMNKDSLIVTEDIQEDQLNPMEIIQVDGECCHQSWTSLTCKFEPRQVDTDALVWEDCANYGLCTAANSYLNCECSCYNGHVRMGNDDGWTYPLDQSAYNPRTSCNEFIFPEGETDPIFKEKENRCQCGHKAECHDVSIIKPSLCGHGTLETFHSFGFHCPTDQTSLTIYLDTYTEGNEFAGFPFVQLDFGTRTTLGMYMEFTIPESIAAGNHSLSFGFPKDVPFKLEFLELVDTDCVLSAEVIVKPSEEDELGVLDKLKQYNGIIFIATAVLFVGLVGLIIWCCCAGQGAPKRAEMSRHPL